jgi:hypothetical protein
LFVGACTVADKNPTTSDGGTDAPVDEGATPNTELTSSPAEFSSSQTATFEFTSDVPTARFTCSIDGDAPQPCTSPFSRTLGDGTHSFSVRAINRTGDGDDSPAEHLWSIDTVAPITTLTEVPPAADNSTMVRVSFMSNEMFTTFDCSLDAALFAPCRTGDTFGPVGDAGNVDASPAVHVWVVDTSTPDTTLIAGPDGSVASATATLAFLSPDAGPGATFECSLDGSPFNACTSPATYGNLAMGAHTFAVRVRDANGNIDPTPATRTWIADITPPETTITDAPTGAIAMASAGVSFTSNEANVTYQCSLDGGPYAGCSSPFNILGLGQGPHTFAVFSTDMAGNADSSPATAGWSVDTTTPEVTFSSGPNTNDVVGPYVYYAFSVSEGAPECRVDGAAWFACAGGVFSFNHPAGTSTFEVRTIDGAGNETVASRSFSVLCAPPDATGAAGQLHLDDNAQVLANATGGASATLGPTADPEDADPAFVPGRFGTGLDFTPGQADSVQWPVALGTQATLSTELWVQPAALSGTRDVITSDDGRYALRVTLDGGSVRFSGTVTDSAGLMTTVTSDLVAASTWHMIALSQTPSLLTLLVDGVVTSMTLARTEITFDVLRVGGTFGGLVDEIWIATTAYTSADELPRFCPVGAIRINTP